MALALQALPPGYRAVVLGASGALGAALLDLLRADPGCALALGLHPGTVTSALSAPFRGAEIGRPPRPPPNCSP